MINNFEEQVAGALTVLRSGGTLLYPTDTVWGLGCDATNPLAIKKIYDIKQRADTKSLIILLAEEKDILQYVAAPDLSVFNFLEQQTRPTTIIFNDAVGLPDNLVAADGSIAIRLVQDVFCRHLIKRLQKPIVSTSANISGEKAPVNFTDISNQIKTLVDHVVQWRQNELTAAQPSQIIKWNNGDYQVIRS